MWTLPTSFVVLVQLAIKAMESTALSFHLMVAILLASRMLIVWLIQEETSAAVLVQLVTKEMVSIALTSTAARPIHALLELLAPINWPLRLDSLVVLVQLVSKAMESIVLTSTAAHPIHALLELLASIGPHLPLAIIAAHVQVDMKAMVFSVVITALALIFHALLVWFVLTFRHPLQEIPNSCVDLALKVLKVMVSIVWTLMDVATTLAHPLWIVWISQHQVWVLFAPIVLRLKMV